MKTHLFVAVALTLGTFACDRNTDKASETNTTSATPPPATETTPEPPPAPVEETQPPPPTPPPALRAPSTNADGRVNTRPSTGSGASTGTQSGSTGNANSGTTAVPDNGTVAPGHIMFPPEKGPGTGLPNSNGSHNLGSGTGAGKR